MITQSYIRNIFYCDPSTGKLFWAIAKSKRVKKGQEVKGYSYKGYYRVKVDGMRYSVHAIIWQWVNGEIPPGFVIDHINGETLDNRISNLRLSTRSENRFNSKGGNSSSGVKGIYWDSCRDKWRAQLIAEGKKVLDKSFG